MALQFDKQDHNGAQTAPAAFQRRVVHGRPVPSRVFGKCHQQNRIRNRDADRHDRSHERLHIQRRSGNEEDQQHAADDGGYRRDDGEGESERLKVRGQ